MQERSSDNLKGYHLRANLPRFFRWAALFLLAVTIAVVAIVFLRGSNNSPFRLKSEHTQLSTDVTADVNGYERLESENGVSKYYIKAERAKTFSDNHQELENAYFEIYDAEGNVANKMTAQQVLYVPEENKNFTAYMRGDVNIETSQALKVKTNNIVYTKANETADADELVEFERENVRGKSLGAIVKIGEKHLELLKNVEIETFESPELARSNVRYAKVNSGSATFDNGQSRIDLRDGVTIAIDSKSKTSGQAVRTDATAARAALHIVSAATAPGQSEMPSAQVRKFEFFDNVHIASVESGAQPTNIYAGYALYDKDADRYEMNGGVHIVTSANDKATDIRASQCVYEQAALKVALSGDAKIDQGSDQLSGDNINADLFADRKLKYAVIRGNGSARQSTSERVTSIAAPELNATFNNAREMQVAHAIGGSVAQLIPVTQADYSLVTMSATRGIKAVFKGAGLLDGMATDGRTTIQLDVPNQGSDAANKRVTADQVRTIFNSNGKDISRAEAVGNAELYIEPLKAADTNYKTTINAPRFDCDFFATGNNAKTCVGGKKTRTVRVPTVAKQGRGNQTLTADQLTANFSAQTKDIESMNASGNAKFSELDRTARSAEMSFTASDETVRMRGGEPTAWDDRGRATAREIDWNTRDQRSYLRGGVTSTYYSKQKMGNAAPFASSDKPVFVTADSAEFDHVAETAAYSGNARGWQENNYVRGDRLFIKQNEGKFSAEGGVQSVVYNAKQKSKGKEVTVPVSASARTMTYDRDSRLIQYRENVDIRQGTDRMTSGSADVFLDENNELSKTIAENSVVITQPGRRATGSWVQYTAMNEIAMLKGSPATVSDAVNGSSQAAELTFMMRENRVASEGKTKSAPTGRIRSTYNIDPKKQ